MKRLLLVLATVLGAVTWAQLVWALPAGTEFQVNTYTTDAQAYPSICAGSSGNFVVTWESYGQDGSNSAVIAQVFASDGSRLGSEFLVNTTTEGNQQFPSVGCDEGGNFVVVWEGNGEDGSSYGVFGQRFDSLGTALGTEFQVNSYTEQRQLAAAICRAPGGEFVVVWNSYEQDGDGYGVFGQRFDSAGAQRGTEFAVNTFTDYSQQYPSVACADSGDFVVVWEGDYEDGDGYGIFGQRFASSGERKGTEFQVHTTTLYYQESPSVASDALGNFVVVWESYSYLDGDSYGIFGQRFDTGGARVGTEFQVNTYTVYAQQSPAVSADPCGNFNVVWSGEVAGGGFDIFGQRFASAGAALGTEFQVNTYTSGDQGAFAALGHVVAISSDATGNFVVVWQSTQSAHPPDGDGSGIFGQRYAENSCTAVCVGDCNHDGIVSVNELVVGVDIALGLLPLSDCTAIDADGDSVVTVDELVAAVNAAIEGCD